jgi:hypothetical protein
MVDGDIGKALPKLKVDEVNVIPEESLIEKNEEVIVEEINFRETKFC